MKAQIVWIGIVVGLLLMSVVTQAVLVIVATTDPSFALEPDYEAKAANWDAVQRQERENARLGWTVDLSANPHPEPGEVEVSITAYGPYGKPLRDATVELEACHIARASRIIRAGLEQTGDGVYTGVLRMRRSGLWEFRLRLGHGEDVYTETVRASVLVTPRSAPSRP